MLRRVLPRFPVFRVATPILPTATRIRTRPTPPLSRTGRTRTSSLRLFHSFPPRLTSASPPRPDSSLPPNATLSQRLKHLITSYGWYALGVYLVLSALDFSVAFAGIQLLGAEQVSRVAAYVKEVAFGFLYNKSPEPGREEIESRVEGGQEGLYAMLVLAYTIHKTLFLPLRVGLTAALTPRLVNCLRMRGWAGGEGTKRAAKEMTDRLRTRKGRD